MGVRQPEPAPTALQSIYRECYKPLVAALTLATSNRSDAEEIAQEAFTRLVSRWARVSQYDDPAAWVRMVAFRLVIDRRRRLLRVARKWINPPGEAAADRADAVDVGRALARLPVAQRQVVVLHYVYDLRVDDIAQVLQVRPGTVKSRLGRARDALSGMLREEVVHD